MSVIDVSEAGRQPIGSEDGTVQVCFNGEIYNFDEIRRDLLAHGHRFASRTDTEVIAHAWEEWGPQAVDRFNGMFAFAVWHRQQRRLWLVRDRLGVKPLYYTHQDGRLVFGSEIKALLAVPGISRSLDPVALDAYLALNYVPGPRTIWQGIEQVPPGHILTTTGRDHTIEPYWDVRFGRDRYTSRTQAIADIRALCDDAVRLRLVSDVPLGAFLSGGLDSTLIASYAARELGSELRTFSMGIPYRDLNELPAAAAVAARYGTRHFAEEVTPMVVRDLPRLIAALDEPADPLSMCLLHLARMTAREVKVVLGGDGGDELFGGYDRYSADRWLDLYRSVPSAVRDLVSSQVLGRLPDQFTFKSFTHKLRWVDQMARKSGGERYAESMQFFWFNEAHRRELYTPEFHRKLGGVRPDACVLDLFAGAPAEDPVDRMMYVDVASRLPGQSLMILDRATMAYSLESRSPFLDVRFAEFMARVPVGLKVRGRRLRYLERKLAERYLPREVLARKKQGFASPLMYILNEEVRRLAPRLLLGSELARDGYLRAERVGELVREHLEGRRDHGNRIWLLLTAEVWYRHFVGRRSAEDLEAELAEVAGTPPASTVLARSAS